MLPLAADALGLDCMGNGGMNNINFSDLTVAYRRHPAIHHLTLSLPAGSLTAMVGPNGAGKSTLMKAIMGQVTPAEGHIELGSLGIRDIAYLPQQHTLNRQFPISVMDFAASGLWQALGPWRSANPAQRKAIRLAIHKVGLTGFESRTIDSLSGGQLQRLMFARLLLQDKPLVLLDEPFNAIDARTAQDLLRLITEWHGQRRTILVVTHDLDQVRQHFPDTLLLSRELLAYGPTHEVLTANNLLKARRLCEAFDESAAVCELNRNRSAA
jgi:zinc/manganese transport system ATP-binding protein